VKEDRWWCRVAVGVGFADGADRTPELVGELRFPAGDAASAIDVCTSASSGQVLDVRLAGAVWSAMCTAIWL
jgi:hypothetical protein